jgi:spermidine synthase
MVPVIVLGLSGMIAQVVLLRELMVTFFGNELSIGIIIADWLILEAAGSLLLGRFLTRIARPCLTFIVIQLVFSMSFPFAILFARIVRNVMALTPGEGLGLLQMVYSTFLILLPVSVSHGSLFIISCQLASRFLKIREKALGKVYVYETVGTALGGIVLTYSLIPFFHSFRIAALLLLLNCAMCTFLFVMSGEKYQTKGVLFAFLLPLLAFSVFFQVSKLPDSLHWLSIERQWRNQDVVFYQNSSYGNVAVTKAGEQFTFYFNGVPIITVPIPDISFMEDFVHLPLLFHPFPQKVLVISGGAGGVINEILKHPVERVDYVELDPLVLETIRTFSTPLTHQELSNPRVHVTKQDGRRYLKTTLRRFDVILVGLSDPGDLQTNRLFSREFFSLIKTKLEPGGIFVVHISGSLTYLSEEVKKLNACIYETLRSVFPEVYVIPGDVNYYIASGPSAEKWGYLPGQLNRRLTERGLNVKLMNPSYIEYRLDKRWSSWFFSSIRGTEVKLNRDFIPSAIFYSLEKWNAKFDPRVLKFLGFFESLNMKMIGVFCAMVLAIFTVCRITIKGKAVKTVIPLCVATTGFAGMIFDVLLILSFQVFYGYVYYLMGLLLTAFMAGTGVAAFIMTSKLGKIGSEKSLFLSFETGIMVFSVLLPVVVLRALPALEKAGGVIIIHALFFFLCFSAGGIIGGEFPLANRIQMGVSDDLGKTAGLLYASDLFGGFSGGIIGGALLLPTVGLTGTCVIVLSLKAAVLLYFLVSARFFDAYPPSSRLPASTEN